MATRAERIEHLEEQLKELKAQEAEKRRREKRARDKKARQERQRFALAFLDFCETFTVTVNGRSVTVHDYVVEQMEQENQAVSSEGGDM